MDGGTPQFLIDAFKAIFRHLFSGVVVWIAAKGVLTEDQAWAAILAIAGVVATLLWSIINKKILHQQIDTALTLPSGTTREDFETKYK